MKLTANAWSNDITQLNSKVLSNETNKLVSNSLYSNNSKLTANSLSINTKILRSNLLKNDSSTRLSTNEEYFKTDRNIHMKTKNDEVKSLDQILKSISSCNNTNTCLKEQFPEDDSVNSSKKRNSFLALESLKDESDHFKRLNSIDHKTVDLHKEKQQDDGVLAKYIRNSQEDDDSMPAVNVGISRVRSYVYGMEAMLHTNKTTVLSTTDSLESRLSDKITSGFSNRSQDWYRRRKSYGFEQVHKPKVDQTNSIVIGNKNSIESPTDVSHSRSTGIVVIPPIFKSNQETSKITTSKGKSNCTVINLNSESINSVNNSNLLKQSNELINVMNNGRANDNSSEDKYMKGAEQVIITIPIISEYTTKNTKQLFQRQISIENLSKTSNHYDNQRHSLAVDDSKYLFSDIKFQNSLQNTIPINSSRIDDDFLNEFESDGNLNLGNRKPKKVEFCKTEVHFAAESGKVNIVETDEKPPPTQNFRRRRRTTSIPNTNNHNPEDANKNCLPLIHFGDTSYEKKLFGISDQDTGAKQQPVIVETYNKSFIGLLNENNNASVSVSITNDYATDHTDTDNNNSENHLRSILKNKMIKPRPYILGDDNNVIFSTEEQEGNEIWGIKLRPVNKSNELNPKIKDKESLLSTWQFSSATNKYNESENHKNYDNNQPEFQKLLHAFKPDLISEPSVPASNVILNKEKGSISEPRRFTWSVPNQVKNDSKESKGFLTKVNFGNDETTVVANSKLLKHTTWPSHGDTQITDDVKQSSVINKGLVVRINKEDSHYIVCSKTIANQNTSTTTTKITIDVSSSPTNLLDNYRILSSMKLPRASLHSLKSTPLIMNTFAKLDNNNIIKSSDDLVNNPSHLPTAIPDKLAALRKLYEAVEHSDDSDKADDEVRSYMDEECTTADNRETEDEISSVVSGSWSKMKAFRNIKHYLNSINENGSKLKDTEMFRNIINRNTYSKKDISSNKSAFQFSKNVTTSQFENQTATNLSGTESAKLSERQTTKLLPKEDPSQNERKKNRNRFEFVRNQYINRYMSSPLLVGNSPESSLSLEKPESVIEKQKRIGAISEYMHSKESSTVPPKSLPKKKIQIQSIYKKDTDLIHSPKPIKRVPIRKQTNENKSNLSQHYNHREYVNLSSVIRDDSKNVVNKSKISYIAKVAPTKSTKRPDSPSIKRSESPIYENIDEVLSGLHSSMEKESAILQELTRAADKILQAVNGYTDDDSTKLSTDSEDENKKHRLKMYRKPDDSLSTISETKSWKQVQNTKQKQAEVNKNIKKPKTRTTSSTSSIESISRESQKIVPPVRMNRASKLTEDKNRKKIAISNSEMSRTTKARRLQRANSREALLQLHGSSSEDMSNEILRKPRMVRRNKTQQSSAEESNNTNEPLTTHTAVPRRRKSDCRRSVDRVPVTSQQETRQKSSVSAVKKEAATTRVKSSEIKINEDLRKRSSIRRDTISSRGNNILTNSRISSTTTPITSTSTKQRSISATTSSTAKTTMRAVHLNSDMTLRKVSQNEGM